jgi:nucleoside-triphosphatase THEP1
VVAAQSIPVVVAAGVRNSGKTAAVSALVERLQRRGVRVTGFVQPGIFEDGLKVGFAVRDLATGEEAVLARVAPERQGDHGTSYLFDDAGFTLARRALGRASPGDLVVVDELGPVELRGQGHMPAVQRALGVPGLAGLVVVVRSQLVPALLAALPVGDASVVEVTDQECAGMLLEALHRVCGGLPGRDA